MNEEMNDMEHAPGQPEVLLALDHEKKTVTAVKGIDKNGVLETVEPLKKNQGQFMRVDKQSDPLSNFLSNFWRQFKDPTGISFVKALESEVVNLAKSLQNHLKQPTEEGAALLAKHEIKPIAENQSQGTAQAAPGNGEYRYQPEQIDWATMNNLGLSRDKLEKMNLLDPL